MNARTAMRRAARDREVSLILTESGAEVVDHGSGTQLWASDTDDTFREDFPELLGEEDVEPVLDYLVEAGILTEAEADEADILVSEDGPGDEDENGDEDEDDNGDDDEDDDED